MERLPFWDWSVQIPSTRDWNKCGVNKHRGSTCRRIVLSQMLHYRKKISNWEKTLKVRKTKDNIFLWLFAVLVRRRGRLACSLCVYLSDKLLYYLSMNPTPSSFLHLTFTEMAENYYSDIIPQFIYPTQYEVELGA